MWRATSRALAALAALLLVALITVGCHGSPAAGDKPVRELLVVAAAANLKFAFDELEAAFERQHPESDLVVTYGSSGQ